MSVHTMCEPGRMLLRRQVCNPPTGGGAIRQRTVCRQNHERAASGDRRAPRLVFLFEIADHEVPPGVGQGAASSSQTAKAGRSAAHVLLHSLGQTAGGSASPSAISVKE